MKMKPLSVGIGAWKWFQFYLYAISNTAKGPARVIISSLILN